ncbi:hypothetical protein L7F22_014731 [Adiantum nelumboides]|nr:hypothetical protein [Adiantum nelumboides]
MGIDSLGGHKGRRGDGNRSLCGRGGVNSPPRGRFRRTSRLPLDVCNNCHRPRNFARDFPSSTTLCNNYGLPGHTATICTHDSACWNYKETGQMQTPAQMKQFVVPLGCRLQEREGLKQLPQSTVTLPKIARTLLCATYAILKAILLVIVNHHCHMDSLWNLNPIWILPTAELAANMACEQRVLSYGNL